MLNCILLALLLSSGAWVHSANSLATPGLFCDFESPCAWMWTGFQVLSGANISASIFNATDHTAMEEISGPVTDADNNPEGNFLYVAGGVGTGKAVELSSPWYQESGPNCQISVVLHMNNMEDANLKLMVETRNHTWVIMETLGDSQRQWKQLTQTVGKISQPFRLKWELLEGLKTPAHAAIDNLLLDQCLTEIPAGLECSPLQRPFRCNDGRCLPRDQVCDISIDCPSAEDEDQDCDKLPLGARCNFETGWCGWSNTLKDDLDWTRHNGTTPTGQTGPSLDNTFKNSTGMYLYVDMSETKEIGNAAYLQSPRFPPPPSYHSNVASPYYNSCQIRFFYHMYGPHIGDLVVRVVEEDPRLRDGKSIQIWREHKNLGNIWKRASVPLPRNMKYWYTVQFIGKRGIRFRGDIAIDDVSLSPECFGIGVPENETLDWPPDLTSVDDPDFIRYSITTCGAKGRIGPFPSLCERAYRGTSTQVQVLGQGRLAGIQVWTVPKTTLYTFIAKGASGGTGSSSSNVGFASHAAVVRAVFRLTAGTQLYILVGQEGTTAAKEKVKSRFARDVPTASEAGPENAKRGVDKIRKLKFSASSGGGGGGATFIFIMDDQGMPVPLLVAGGGGGMSSMEEHPMYDVTDGRGFNGSLPPLSGRGYPKAAGAGGGWNGSRETETAGFSLLEGGLGGYSCSEIGDWSTHGGFGGGGGACLGGGGGGGYSGGYSFLESNKSGEGGHSFVSSEALQWSIETETGQHLGPGSVDILPAVNEGCDCEALCVTLDVAITETQCVCPDWQPEENGTGCDVMDSSRLIGVISAVVFVVLVFGLAFSFLYNRYQRKKLAALRRKAMAVPELQLSRLRGTSSGMVTEYNPNYEFGTAGPGSAQDLKDIPRENLRLVRALGQGAFGEVYQGYLRHVAGDSVEMPVAVKTLPELSSNQAEMDFLMEALIMSKFHHPNIVHFIGVCFDKHPRFIVLELLSGGDLKTFLRESRPKPDRPAVITMKDLLKCALDVAKGCRYLEENHFIHRDIAARNCLLTTKGPGRVVKIADFGMARDIYRADYYRKGGKAMLPVKWMPPEAFLDGIFTSKTDVWSFGVLLWEVMSLGYMPYPGRGNQEVMQLVTNGGRLEAPPGCPAAVHRVMTQCWHANSEERPSFVTVLERIGYCMQDPDVLATPLPVFHRLPSAERDTTVVRPPAGSETSECLRVLRPFNANGSAAGSKPPTQSNNSSFRNSSSADYLIPLANPAGPSETAAERAERSGYWETSFTKEGVKILARGDPLEEAQPEISAPQPAASRPGSQRKPKIAASIGLSQSQSSQPLIGSTSPPESPDVDKKPVLPERKGSYGGSAPLDAALLYRQSYANIRVTGTPTRTSQKSLRENEISC